MCCANQLGVLGSYPFHPFLVTVDANHLSCPHFKFLAFLFYTISLMYGNISWKQEQL